MSLSSEAITESEPLSKTVETTEKRDSLQSEQTRAASNHCTNRRSQKKKPTAKYMKILKKEECDNKRKSMRTAGDVRKRIQWDTGLPEEHFSVGYLDRFVGIIEKPFSSFTWEHLALVGLDDLAIPQHRIQYFKYKDTIVWDKRNRLDNVFGSTGSGTTIFKAMHDIDERIKLREEEEISDDDDDDVELCVTADVKSLLPSVNLPKPDSLRATHFMCVKIADSSIRETVERVQQHIVTADPILRRCVMDLDLLHVTLAMVRCESAECLEDISNYLRDLRCELTSLLPAREKEATGRSISIRGLSTFGARVLYAKLEVPPLFHEIVGRIHRFVRATEGAAITNDFDFVPHMTLLKVSRPVAKERRSKYVDSRLYCRYSELNFGSAPLDNVSFCSIEDRRGLDRFYVTLSQIQF